MSVPSSPPGAPGESAPPMPANVVAPLSIFQRQRGLCIAVGLVVIAGAGLAFYQFGLRLWADSQYAAAKEAGARHDYHEAGTRLEAFIQVRPDDPAGWLLVAQTARQSGDFAHAEQFLRVAETKRAPAAGIALERRLLPLHSGNLQQSDPLLDLCAREPHKEESALILEAIAEGSLRARDVPRLRAAAQLWLKQSTSAADQAHGYVWLGHANKLGNETGPAIANFQKAVELDPDHPFARILLAASLIHDQPEDARPHLDLLRRKKPDDPEVLFQTARMHRQLGQLEEAARLLDQVLASGPNLVPALTERARIAMDLKQPEQAERWLQKARRRAPNDRLVLITLGDCMRQLGKPAEAKALHEQAAQIEDQRKRSEASRYEKP